ncbi:MAG: protein-disulfide reductase DsbD domain-containing protein [Terracidiphilus sp.]
MNKLIRKIGSTVTAAITLVALTAHTQTFSSQDRPLLKSDAVLYLFPEQVTVSAGKSSPINLHFRVAPGLHINSHAPSEDYLIPTTFSIPDGAGVKLDKATYPSGVYITLPGDPNTKLSVYTGEFTIQTQIVATPGNHLVEANLRYQACNQSQCFPPKTVPVAIDVIGK